MIYKVFNVLLTVGPTVMLPVIMFIIGLIFSVRPAKVLEDFSYNK